MTWCLNILRKCICTLYFEKKAGDLLGMYQKKNNPNHLGTNGDTVALLDDLEDEDECELCDEENECIDCTCLGAFLIPPQDHGSYINIRALHRLGLGSLDDFYFSLFFLFLHETFTSNVLPFSVYFHLLHAWFQFTAVQSNKTSKHQIHISSRS